MTLKDLEAKVDAGALIADMTAELKFASDRWEEVCRTYGTGWTDAWSIHSKTLEEVQKKKEARLKAERDFIAGCLEMACVFLPLIGGPIALSFAPIISTRAKLLVSVVTKRASASWTILAANRPITTQILKQIGEVSASKAKEAREKIETGIVQALSPKEPDIKAVPSVTDPATEFINNSRRVLDNMNEWVRNCAKWNVSGGVERLLIPVAHDLFMNHPWVKTAPAIEASQKLKAPITSVIEMALWLRWAKGLDEKYWREVHDWYENSYQRASQEGKSYQSRSHQSWVEDALDFQPVYFRLQSLMNFRRLFNTMTLYSPDTRLDHPTVDLYMLQNTAKNARNSSYLLEMFLPSEKRQSQFIKELSKM